MHCQNCTERMREFNEKFQVCIKRILGGKFHFESLCAMALTTLEIAVNLVSSRASAIGLEHHVIHAEHFCIRTNWISPSFYFDLKLISLVQMLERKNAIGRGRYLRISFENLFFETWCLQKNLLIFIHF